MKNIKLEIEFDGTNYHGWQSQINAVTVQDVVEDAIKTLTGEYCALTGASRTDAGVHALGFAANFKTESSIPPGRFSYALNGILPEDISVKSSMEVEDSFHARYSARAKLYKYLIYNHSQPSALLRKRAWHVSGVLDSESMKQAIKHFLGTHCFTSFKSSGSSAKSDVRTIQKVELACEEDIIKFEIQGDGFLYNMIRILAGTLKEVGTGKLRPDEMKEIILSCNRDRAGLTAPPHGLYLVKVIYSIQQM